ncbi:MAG TPA: acyl-CoA dehydrogenase family protein [Pirellulales bacterium]|nr:acyl-CoA dehydrogenase family protein [Pirellulales bacterium]
MKTDQPELSGSPKTQRPGGGSAGADGDGEKQSFAETALKLGGKSDEEARRTGAIDKADDQVEALFLPQYQTTASPAHRAVWEGRVPVELFSCPPPATPPHVAKVMEDSLAVVRRHREAGTVLDEQRKVSNQVLEELATAGYWGLLVDREYGGAGAPFGCFAPFLTRMAMLDPTTAGMASVHGCIGAVDPVRTFGNVEQKQRFLPRLASGQSLSAFALTEPNAGSDLTALRTRAVLDGDDFVVNGEKLFITNVVPGRTIGLVCLIDKCPAVLIVDLPAEENEQFQLKRYGLYALKHTYNQGIVFRDLRVPAANLLRPTRGDGLTIAYHGLNLGRIALCATAAGSMRLMLASMLPWARFRKTYGQAIERRELVRRRLGRMAGLIVAADALVEWCSGLIDQGYRGEMECIVAKIFGSEAQKEAAVELLMKTHGGRSFLHGHVFGDNVHEFLAPCIYEGEGEMLGMAFFKSLVKQHGTRYFEPIGKTLAAVGIKKPNLLNPAHALALKGPLWDYGKWWLGQKLHVAGKPELPAMPDVLREHAEFAVDWLARSPLEVSGTMRKHQLALADRQCRMAELSRRVQDVMIILCTSLYAARQQDELVRAAADTFCQDLRRQLSGRRPSDRHFRAITKLGEQIADGGFKSIAGLKAGEILMPYEND